ncbi:MAG: BatD family protein [Ignavibacteria bacterium]
MKKTFYIFLLQFLFLANIFPQKFEATVDRTTVGQYERFKVYFTFEGGDVNRVSNFTPPAFIGFKILTGPNQSTSMQIINGQMSGSLTYSYVLQADEVGDYKINFASVEYEGKKYNTGTIQIKVIKGTGSPSQPQKNDRGISDEELAKNVFIKATVDKTSALMGEQITLTYKLYFKTNIESPSFSKLPSYNGFWAEELEQPTNLRPQVEMYNGERYQSVVIKRAALFPTKTGKLTISPLELNVPVIIRRRRTGNDIFDDFFNDSFFSRNEKIDYTAKSNSAVVNIKPLPGNAPESFNGAVGKFNFNASIDKNEVEQNDAVTIKIDVSGQGNIALLDIPEIKLPPGFEQYDPKTSESIVKENIITGRKSIEYLVVPRVSGQKTIEPIEFTFFDISRKRYVTLTSLEFKLDISRAEGVVDAPVAGLSKEEVRLLSQDIRFIKISSFNFSKKGEFALIKSWFWFTAIIPLIVLLSVLEIKRRQDKLYGNVKLLKYQKAEKFAKQRLKISKKALDSNDLSKFYEELSSAIFGYLEDKLSIQKSEMSLDKAVDELSKRGTETELIDKLKTTAEKCEFARFAPSSGTGQEESELYQSTVKLIVDLENSLAGNRRR